MNANMNHLKRRFEHAIALWDRGNRNHHAGAIALLRLDDCMAEIVTGKDVEQALRDNFNDRLLDRLLLTASQQRT